MRIFSGIFCISMALFTVVQFNDPDASLWIVIYGVAAIWCGLAAFRPSLIAVGWGRRLLILSVLLGLIGAIWYYPKTPGFWHTDVWWVTETAREGMGMIIAFVAILVAWLTVRRLTLVT
ncbi:MAG: hypothetical protein ACI8R4_002087 [Paracoccaceae bacterium]|jgi:hypothetical protein